MTKAEFKTVCESLVTYPSVSLFTDTWIEIARSFDPKLAELCAAHRELGVQIRDYLKTRLDHG